MNSFRLIDTSVVKSEMDFTKTTKDAMLKGTVNLSTSTKTPKDAQKNRKVYCAVILSLSGKDDSVFIRMKTFSEFEIVELCDPDTLRKDAAKYCSRQAMEATLKKLELLTEVHLGEPLHIPLPPETE